VRRDSSDVKGPEPTKAEQELTAEIIMIKEEGKNPSKRSNKAKEREREREREKRKIKKKNKDRKEERIKRIEIKSNGDNKYLG